MRTFYTGSDIEDLAASGIRQLEVGPGVAPTDAARQLAEELGIALVAPGAAPASKATMPMLGAAEWSDVSLSFIVNAIILIYVMLPGVKDAFDVT